MLLDSRFKRKSKGKTPRDFHVIFCEGKSEMIYFEYLNTKSSKNIICKELTHKDFEGIAREINIVIDSNGLSLDDNIYCVIDKDNHSLDEYKNGCNQIEEFAKVIFSSKSFEIWVLMHFSPFERAVLKADDYKQYINSSNNKKYFKSKGITGEVWKPYSKQIREALYEETRTAIKNAKLVSKKQLEENGNKFNCDAYTDIGDLVEILLNS